MSVTSVINPTNKQFMPGNTGKRSGILSLLCPVVAELWRQIWSYQFSQEMPRQRPRIKVNSRSTYHTSLEKEKLMKGRKHTLFSIRVCSFEWSFHDRSHLLNVVPFCGEDDHSSCNFPLRKEIILLAQVIVAHISICCFPLFVYSTRSFP